MTKQVFRVRQIGNDVLGDPIGEAIPLGIVPNVVEGQDSNGGFIG